MLITVAGNPPPTAPWLPCPELSVLSSELRKTTISPISMTLVALVPFLPRGAIPTRQMNMGLGSGQLAPELGGIRGQA